MKYLLIIIVTIPLGIFIGKFTTPPVYALSPLQINESERLIQKANHFQMKALKLSHELDRIRSVKCTAMKNDFMICPKNMMGFYLK